jgi:DNA-binding response OmpR family regulator
VFDASADVLEMVETFLTGKGYEVHTGLLRDLENGATDPVELINRTSPDVVVYDIDPPYSIKWQAVLALACEPSVTSPFVFTTTNPSVVSELLKGSTSARLLAKPYDLDDLAAAIEEALQRPSDRRHLLDRRSGEDRRRSDRRRDEDENQ